MGKIAFRFLEQRQREEVLPEMYDILFANMSPIAPTGNDYEEDRRIWMSYMMSAQGREAQILLMYVGETLAGYFQYCIDRDVIRVDEVEIRPAYQRTALFYRFLQFLAGAIPEEVRHIDAYINKHNANSQRIAEKLGMKIVGENKSGRSWHYQGGLDDFKRLKVFHKAYADS